MIAHRPYARNSIYGNRRFGQWWEGIETMSGADVGDGTGFSLLMRPSLLAAVFYQAKTLTVSTDIADNPITGDTVLIGSSIGVKSTADTQADTFCNAYAHVLNPGMNGYFVVTPYDFSVPAIIGATGQPKFYSDDIYPPLIYTATTTGMTPETVTTIMGGMGTADEFAGTLHFLGNDISLWRNTGASVSGDVTIDIGSTW